MDLGYCGGIVFDQGCVFDRCVDFVVFDLIGFGVGEYEFVIGDIDLIVVKVDCIYFVFQIC